MLNSVYHLYFLNCLIISICQSFFTVLIYFFKSVVFLNPPVEGTVNSMEQKSRVFCLNDVQEFHLGYRNTRAEARFWSLSLGGRAG